MDDPIRGGAFSVLLLFGLLAELSQIDDLAHSAHLELYSVWTLSKSRGLHEICNPAAPHTRILSVILTVFSSVSQDTVR